MSSPPQSAMKVAALGLQRLQKEAGMIRGALSSAARLPQEV